MCCLYISSILFWNYKGALLIPKGKTFHWYWPCGTTNAFLYLLLTSIPILVKPGLQVKLTKYSTFWDSLQQTSFVGKEYLTSCKTLARNTTNLGFSLVISERLFTMKAWHAQRTFWGFNKTFREEIFYFSLRKLSLWRTHNVCRGFMRNWFYWRVKRQRQYFSLV